MKPTFHSKTNKQKSYDDLNQIQHCGDEGYSLVNHYLLKHIPKPFPVGLGCEGFWWPTHKECFLRSLIRWANYLQGIQHVSCTTTYHIHNEYIQVLPFLTFAGYLCLWDGTEGQCALSIYVHFSIQYSDIIHLVLVTIIWDISRTLAGLSLYTLYGYILSTNENSVTIYSPWCCSKPVCLSFFCRTQKYILKNVVICDNW